MSLLQNHTGKAVQYCTAFFVLLFLPVLLPAQEAILSEYQVCYGFPEKTTVYLFSDSANIREEAGTAAARKDILYAGQQLQLLSRGQEATMNGRQSFWYQAGYHKNGEYRTGYIWGGLLSLGTISKDGHLFLYALKYPEADSLPMVVDVKVLQEGRLADRTSFSFTDMEAGAFHAHGWSAASHGLPGLKGLLVLSFSGAACGIATYEQYFGWTGGHLVRFPQLMSVSDAGVYSSVQEFIFPSGKGGQRGILLKRETNEETDEDGKVSSHKVSTERYRWSPEQERFVKQ